MLKLNRHNFVILFLTLLLVGSCSKKSGDQAIKDSEIIAQVGDRKITAGDFKMSYEQLAVIPTNKKGFAAKEEQLTRLVQRKLFAAEAEELGLDKDAKIQEYLKWFRRKAAIHELYRQEITAAIHISEAEVREAFAKSKIKIRARHLFAPTAMEAEALLDRLRTGESFASLAKMVFRHSALAESGGDLGYFSWGDLDENIEAAAFSLQPGEISNPVHSQYGWHIIQVTDVQKDVFLTEADFDRQKKKIVAKLKNRKGESLAKKYIKQIMEPQNVVLKGQPFTMLAREFEKEFGNNKSLLPSFAPNVFSPELNKIAGNLENHSQESLLIFEGGIWTIGDFIQRLESIPAEDRPVYKNPQKLSEDIGILFRDNVLAEIALQKGLDKQPDARKEWQNRRDDALASWLVAQLVDTVQITAEEIERYYFRHPDEFANPETVNIREILVRSQDLAQQLLHRIEKGEDMAKLAEQYSIRKWAAKQKGEFGFCAKGTFGEIGEIAFQYPVGTLVGPIEIAGGPPGGGYSIFRILAKKKAKQIAFETAKTDLQKRLLHRRRENAISLFTEQLKNKYSIKTDPGKIRQIAIIDDNGVRPLFIFRQNSF